MRYYKDSCYDRHTEMLTNNIKDNLNFSTLPEHNSKRHTESNSKIGPLLAIDIDHRAIELACMAVVGARMPRSMGGHGSLSHVYGNLEK
jgi:hypothetical protein